MKKIYIVLLALLGISFSQAQVRQNYSMVYSTGGTYTPITGGTVIQNFTNVTALRDTVLNNIPIGFTFSYNTKNYSEVNMSQNGFLFFGKLGQGQLSGWGGPLTNLNPTLTNSGVSTTSRYEGAIHGFGGSIQAQGTGYQIRYETIGTAPNRQFVMQWTDVKISTDATMRLSFQIVLNETSNSIDINYGGTIAQATSARTASIGLRGGNDEDARTISVPATAAWSTATLTLLNSSSASFGITGTAIPVSGDKITFTTSAVAPTPVYSTTPLTPVIFTGPWLSSSLGFLDKPNANMSTWPSYGNSSWKIDTTGASSGWSAISTGLPAASPVGNNFARFHSYDANANQIGNLDYYVDLSSITASKDVEFDYINTGTLETDTLKVLFSTDGGLTFTLLGFYVNSGATGTVWTPKVLTIGTTTTSTGVIRFSARGQFNGSDIGLDNVKITVPCSGTPNAGLITGTNALCTGNTGTTLTLTGASSGSGLTYQWGVATVSGGPYTNLGTTLSQATGALSATSYYVLTSTCANGGAIATSPQFTVTVNPNPTVGVTGSATSLCYPNGAAIPLTASGAATYAWSPAAGLSAVTGASVNAFPAATTTYTVTGTDANNCVGTATYSITSNQEPILASVTATPASVCANGSSALLASVLEPSVVSLYTFAAGTGATLDPMTGATQVLNASNDDTPTPTAVALGFTFNYNGVNYTQYSISPDGWILLGGATAISQFTNAMTSTTNIPKLAPYWDDMATGTDGNVKVLVTGTAPNRIFKAQWFVTIPRNTGGAANSTFQAWLYEGSNKIEYRYGAMGPSTTQSASAGLAAGATNFVSATISAGTVSTATANDGNTGVPTLGTLYTFNLPVSTTTTYAWTPATNLNNTNTANPTASNITANITYNVLATATNSCTASGSASITAGSVLSSSASITANDSACVGQTVTLNAIPVGGGAPYTYAWTGPSGFTSALQNPTVVASASTAGTYSVIINDNCLATSNASATLAVSAYPVISAAPSSATYCSGAAGVAISASGANTYTWSPAAGLNTTTGASVSATPIANTTYQVIGANLFGCSDTATVSISTANTPVITASNPAALCGTGNTTLTASALVPAGAYCQPIYTNGTSFGDYISLVQLGTLNNATVGASTPYYTLVPEGPTTTASIAAGSSQTITLAAGTYTINDLAAWIDYNQDGVFDATEKLGETDNFGAAPLTTVFTFTVPVGALDGKTRLRVREMDYSGTNTMDPCTSQSTFGETEDYTITITGGISAITYAWSPATFLSSTSVASPSVTAASTSTNYTLTATSGSGCPSTASVALTVNTLPTVTASASSAAVCVGASTTLTGGGASSYTWDNGVTNGVAITPTATLTYTVTGTDVNGCSNTATQTVTVNTLPTVTANASSTSVCAGSSVTLTGGGATSYSWDNGVTNGVAITPAATATYNVTGTDANGCQGTASVAVTVNAQPIANLPATISTCNATEVLDAGNATLPGVSYLWNTGATTQTITASINGNYSVTVTGTGACSISDTVNVTLNSGVATANVSAASVSICQGASTTLVGTPSGGTFSANGTGSVFNGANTGTFDVIYTVTTTCGTATDTVSITVNANPVTSITPSSPTICAGGATAVTLTGSPAGGTFSVQSGTASALTGNSFNPTATGTWTIVYTFTNASGCPDTSNINFNVNCTVGLNDLSKGVAAIQVVPNPTAGNFDLNISNASDKATIKLLSFDGRLLATEKVDLNNNNTVKMNIANYANGIYFVNVVSGNINKTIKITKQD
jgi:GEVED domain/Secretion system C-terminal sorting domain